jgi:hypothetical protein
MCTEYLRPALHRNAKVKTLRACSGKFVIYPEWCHEINVVGLKEIKEYCYERCTD